MAPTPIDENLQRRDLSIMCIAWGWSLGFGFLTGLTCWNQTARMRRPFHSLYAWLIWLELISSQIQGVGFFLLNSGIIPMCYPSLWAVFVPYVFQTQCLLQIICNRVALVEVNVRRLWWIKRVVLVLVGLVNISVAVIWMPAEMKKSWTFVHVNEIWDRCGKGLFLLIDLSLNIYFVVMVKRKLVSNGMTKYDRLVRFNQRIIFVSIMMDALLLASMSFTSGTVYGQIHPVTYLIKLNIELSLASLIVTLAAEKDLNITMNPNETFIESERRKSFSYATDVTMVETAYTTAGAAGSNIPSRTSTDSRGGRDDVDELKKDHSITTMHTQSCAGFKTSSEASLPG